MTSTATLPAASGRAGSRAATRQRLLAAARRAFARRGLAGTNLKDDVLVPARVSVGSFYHQFEDKTDLFLAVCEEHSRTFLAMIHEAHTPRPTAEPGAIARHSFATVFRIAEQNDDLFRIMVRERESEDARVRSYLRDNHRRWIESLAEDYRRIGIPAPRGDADLRLAAELVSAMTLGTVLSYLERPARERPRERARLIDGLVRFTIGGLMALVSEAPVPVPGAAPGARRKGAR